MSRSREDAITEYQRQIGIILNCVSHAWAYSFPVKGSPDGNEFMLVSQDRNVSATSSMLRMSRGKERLFLEASQRFKIFEDNGFRISTLKYNYVIWSSKTDERIIDWHYHRRQNNSFQAHLHIRDDAKATSHNLVNRHIPTGRLDRDKELASKTSSKQRTSPKFTKIDSSEPAPESARVALPEARASASTITAELINAETGTKLRIFSGADQATLAAVLAVWSGG